MNTDTLVDKHYGINGLMDGIVSGLKMAGKDIDSLTGDDLAPIDEFHTRGKEATLEVAELTNIEPSDVVLDVGCGLGGTARQLAKRYKCTVVGIDLTEEYISVGNKLTEIVGLQDRVELRHGSALEIPYEDASMQIVWTEHVQMNIADKSRFYAEIARVLEPGGRLLFHDFFRGFGEAPVYPTPWAENESISCLATVAEARWIIEQQGLRIDQWIEKSRESKEFFKKAAAKIDADGGPPLGTHLLMGDNASDKLRNCVLNLDENRVSVAMGMARKS